MLDAGEPPCKGIDQFPPPLRHTARIGDLLKVGGDVIDIVRVKRADLGVLERDLTQRTLDIGQGDRAHFTPILRHDQIRLETL